MMEEDNDHRPSFWDIFDFFIEFLCCNLEAQNRFLLIVTVATIYWPEYGIQVDNIVFQ